MALGGESQCLLIGDAGILIGFIAAGQHQLLLAVTNKRSMSVFVPEKVDEEIRDVLTRNNRIAALRSWQWMKDQEHATILDESNIDPEELHAVNILVTKYLEVSLDTLHATNKDKGEAFVVAHAVHMSQRGEVVLVAIDDKKGRNWAHAKNLPCIQTETILEYAVNDGHIATKAELRTIYTSLSRHSTLPDLRHMQAWKALC